MRLQNLHKYQLHHDSSQTDYYSHLAARRYMSTCFEKSKMLINKFHVARKAEKCHMEIMWKAKTTSECIMFPR